MTLKQLKAEILEEFERKFYVKEPGFVFGKVMDEKITTFLSTALDRVAEETVKAIVPEEKDLADNTREQNFALIDAGHNSCRSQALQNYKQFTNGLLGIPSSVRSKTYPQVSLDNLIAGTIMATLEGKTKSL